MLTDFNTHGVATIARARDEDPIGYIKVVSGLLPKQLTDENGDPLFSGITVNFVRSNPKS
jgi:hypothetical protein